MLFPLVFAAVVLTSVMFSSKQSMLGFPSLIFWAILGGYCYQQSSATWDVYYLMFFGSMGMAIFSTFAAFGLRTKKEELIEGGEYIDEGKDELTFIDEKQPDEYASPSEQKKYYDEFGNPRRKQVAVAEEEPSPRIKALRNRALKRRSKR